MLLVSSFLSKTVVDVNRQSDGIRKKTAPLGEASSAVINVVKKQTKAPKTNEERQESFIRKIASVQPPDEGFVITEPPRDTVAESVPTTPKISSFLSFLEKTGHVFRVVPFAKSTLLGLVIFVVTLVVLSTVFARVTVQINPQQENNEFRDLNFVLDSDPNQPTNGSQKFIPAERLEFSRSVSVEKESTGKKNVEAKAYGKAKIYNRYGSASQALIQNTRFLTDSGALYRLAASVVVPGAQIKEGKVIPQSVDVQLVADKAGESGNKSGEINLTIPGFEGTPKHDGFYAVASQGFSGGLIGEARVATKGDLKGAQEEATKKIYDELRQEIVRKIPPDFKVIDPLKEIQITNLESPRENTPGDRFTIKVDARARVIVFRENDVTELLRKLIIKDGKNELVPGSLELDYQIRSVDFEKGRGEITIAGKTKTRAIIPTPELANLLTGKKEGSITEILKSRPEISSFKLTFFPPWLLSVPQDPTKVRFKIN